MCRMRNSRIWIAGSSPSQQSLIVEVSAAYEDYEPTKAARAIQEFVNDNLSNWYVRHEIVNVFWVGQMTEDKSSVRNIILFGGGPGIIDGANRTVLCG